MNFAVLPLDTSIFWIFRSTTCGEGPSWPPSVSHRFDPNRGCAGASCGLGRARHDCQHWEEGYKLTASQQMVLKQLPKWTPGQLQVFFSDVYTGKIYVDSWTERHRKERYRNESIVLSLPAKTEHFGSGLKDSQDDSILSARAVRWSFWCWPFCSPVFFFCGCLVLMQQDLHKPT